MQQKSLNQLVLRMSVSLLLVVLVSFCQVNEGLWKSFEEVSFESRYVESEQASFYFPSFPAELRKLEGKKVRITGFYLPIDVSSDALVLSRYPMATCFFCGEAGPESVMMVYPRERLDGLKMDEEVVFEGILELNSEDVYQLSFILKDAKRL